MLTDVWAHICAELYVYSRRRGLNMHGKIEQRNMMDVDRDNAVFGRLEARGRQEIRLK